MGHSFAAVDLGATSGRVVVGTFDDDGFSLTEAHRFANDPIVVDGVRCWNHDLLFAETLTGLTKAVTIAENRRSPLRGIGVDSWGVDYGLVDASNSLVYPPRHYRTAQESVVHSATTFVPSSEAYARTGIIESPINTCFQLIRDADAGLLDGSRIALLTPDLWTAWLTGARAAERTIASTTGLVDWETGNWAEDLMDRYGIPRSAVPPIVETGSRAGQTLPAITQSIGAPEPIDVFRVGAHDTANAFAAVTDSTRDAIVISCGTWALAGRLHHEPILTAQAMAYGFTNEMAADRSALIVRNLSGTWLLDECLRQWAAQDGLDDLTGLRADLLRKAANDDVSIAGAIDCGSPALVGTTDMPGEINRLYTQDTGGPSLDRVHMVALILESLAQSFADTIGQLEELTGVRPRQVVMIGGGSRIESLVERTGEVTGLPVVVSHQEATSIGSICIQAAAAGVFTDVPQARGAVDATFTGSSDD